MIESRLIDERRRVLVQSAMLLAVVAALVRSCFGAPYPDDLALQHIMTVVALVALAASIVWFPLGHGPLAALLAFVLLHVVGARYLYSYVPYDRWAEQFLGVNISQTFSFERNHYDRLVHFGFGLLIAWPAREVVLRYIGAPRRWSYYLVVDFIIASSAMYELAEWMVAIGLSPEAAENYNGQQGDVWDAHKDMALAAGGALLSMTLAALIDWKARLRGPAGGG
ncbi:MAG: DUF2238 domain-containing protein [Planctomycetes bacterium]|nr:DUF2238 domain-containing protein [Planctomycetota bacterium]